MCVCMHVCACVSSVVHIHNICDCLSENPPVHTCQYFKAYHFKNSVEKKPALPW